MEVGDETKMEQRLICATAARPTKEKNCAGTTNNTGGQDLGCAFVLSRTLSHTLNAGCGCGNLEGA